MMPPIAKIDSTALKAVMASQEELHSRALLLVVIFTGLRSSELRGLAWPNTDLKKDEVHVCQRAAQRRRQR
jgi:integrase